MQHRDVRYELRAAIVRHEEATDTNHHALSGRRLLACALTRLFRSRARLEAEILVLRHQLNVLRRKAPKRVAFSSIDRLVIAGLYRLAPGVLDA